MDGNHLSLPRILGLTPRDIYSSAGRIVCYMSPNDEEAERELVALLDIINHPEVEKQFLDSLSPNDMARVVSLAIINNRCGSCGSGEFRRDFRVDGSPKRIVDMLYCESCRAPMRVLGNDRCEGLSPSPSSQKTAMLIISKFKEYWGDPGLDESYGR